MSQRSNTIEITSPVVIEPPVIPTLCYGHHPLANNLLKLIGQFTPARPTLEIEEQTVRLTCTQLTASSTCALTPRERCWQVNAIKAEIEYKQWIADILPLLSDELTDKEDDSSIFPEPQGSHYP